MQTLNPIRTRSVARTRLVGRPTGALARLVSLTQAPVIGLVGTGPNAITLQLLAEMLRADRRKVAVGMAEALTAASDLGPEDRILIEITPALMRHAPHGLSTVVVAGIAPDELAPGQEMAEAVDGLRRSIAAAQETVIVNADDARALALAAEARVEVLRVSARDRSADASLRSGEMIVIDPLLGLERRVCSLDRCPSGNPAYVQSLLLAGAAAVAAGAAVDAIRASAQSQVLGSGRLERLASDDRLVWINDGAATRPGLAARSLGGLEEGLPIILIAGGRHGGHSLSRWAMRAAEFAEHVLVFGSAAPVLAAALEAAGGATVVRCADLEDAVVSARHLARPRQRILFSPGCEADSLESPTPMEQFSALVSGETTKREAEAA